MFFVCRRLFCCWLLLLGALTASGESGRRVLRVAADPNNLPFSNERLEGFENRLAELVARELGVRLEYMWWPQRRGFIRETINAGRADLVIGVPAGYELVATTRPYYYSGYVVVRAAGTAPVRSFDDPRLRTWRVGVQLTGDDFYNTPPAHALAHRGIIENVRGYTVYGNYAEDSPPSAIVKAVGRGEIDVALVWGPLAGYFSRQQTPPLVVDLLAAPEDGAFLPLVFGIAMGVRRGDQALKDEVQAILDRRADEVAQILAQYGVPRLPPSPRRVNDDDHGDG